ncbi:hypothetical protein ACQCT6_06520 [Cytobacillus gottheilii]|uniref:Transcriptional regulator n=1 Tax=Cytobacillus gottheilii TaxID=859144 RepID=A0ABX8FGD3_9BACI|nr:hypothetical protein [Cytobacillus gottheilii]QVY63094.1 hypothetical protein J1899_08660 [Cytobacillus gottheilii]
MVKKASKNRPDQKNKKGFDSAVTDTEFAHELGSAAANKEHHNKAKKEKAAKNNGKFKG